MELMVRSSDPAPSLFMSDATHAIRALGKSRREGAFANPLGLTERGWCNLIVLVLQQAGIPTRLAQGKGWGFPHSADMDFAREFPVDFEFSCVGVVSAQGPEVWLDILGSTGLDEIAQTTARARTWEYFGVDNSELRPEIVSQPEATWPTFSSPEDQANYGEMVEAVIAYLTAHRLEETLPPAKAPARPSRL